MHPQECELSRVLVQWLLGLLNEMHQSRKESLEKKRTTKCSQHQFNDLKGGSCILARKVNRQMQDIFRKLLG